jgi:hypothetical protein
MAIYSSLCLGCHVREHDFEMTKEGITIGWVYDHQNKMDMRSRN